MTFCRSFCSRILALDPDYGGHDDVDYSHRFVLWILASKTSERKNNDYFLGAKGYVSMSDGCYFPRGDKTDYRDHGNLGAWTMMTAATAVSDVVRHGRNGRLRNGHPNGLDDDDCAFGATGHVTGDV